MADSQSSTSTVQITMEFGDGTEQTITQNNPTNTNLIDKINTFGNYLIQNQILTSTKSEAHPTNVKSAKTVQRTVTNYDLG